MKNKKQAQEQMEILRADQRGTLDQGWLQANYSFSFANYYDAQRLGFGPLRVLNQDHIQPNGGFGTHGHDNMEIITWVQAGELRHEDSMGNVGTLVPGDIQVMSAGRGLTHSEVNPSQTEGIDLLQMWIMPRSQDVAPTWEQRHSSKAERLGRFSQLVGPHEEAREGLLTIDQDAWLFAALLGPGDETELKLEANRRAYVHVATGAIQLDGQQLSAGDGAEINPKNEIRTLAFQGLETAGPADVVVWQLL